MRRERRWRSATVALAGLLLAVPTAGRAAVPGPLAQEVAASARERYGEATVSMLAELVAFRTVAEKGTANRDQPEFRALTRYLREAAQRLGLDFADHGDVVIIGLGEGPRRLGIVTHADVQPAEAARWETDPFRLDTAREPGRLVGRGTIDDKGPLAAVLHALRAIADAGVELERRVEVVVGYTEESDWDAFRRFLAGWEPPEINIALDANYPVVIAEKGFGTIHLTVPAEPEDGGEGPALAAFEGGAFLSQVPETARALVASPIAALEETLRRAAAADPEVAYTFVEASGDLEIRAEGRSAHSMEPWNGTNAITHLAAILAGWEWSPGPEARMVRLIDDLVGTGDLAERFGDLAYEHPFMGPLTLTLATVKREGKALVAGLSLRRPQGRTAEEVERSIEQAVSAWSRRSSTPGLGVEVQLYDPPYYQPDAPQVPVLLDVFRHYTGRTDARPIAIGGGTNVRLLPYGVSFGPAMPDEPYTGHTEHEFITRDQLLLSLEMYTAMLVELAGPGAPDVR